MTHDTTRRSVALFSDPAEGWEFVISLTAGDLAEVRMRYRRGELDRLTIMKVRNRFALP